MISSMSQSLFYWITYSYFTNISVTCACSYCLNPYFIGLPILIMNNNNNNNVQNQKSQSLFYWITYSYKLIWRT